VLVITRAVGEKIYIGENITVVWCRSRAIRSNSPLKHPQASASIAAKCIGG